MDKSGLLEHCRPKSGTRIASRKCQFWPICALKFKYLVRLKFSIFRFFIILNLLYQNVFLRHCVPLLFRGLSESLLHPRLLAREQDHLPKAFLSAFWGYVAASADLLSSQLVVKLKQRRSQQRFCLLYPTLLSEGALSRTSVFIQLRKCPLSFTMDSEVNQVENGVKNLGLHSTSGKTKFQIFFQGHWAKFFLCIWNVAKVYWTFLCVEIHSRIYNLLSIYFEGF